MTKTAMKPRYPTNIVLLTISLIVVLSHVAFATMDANTILQKCLAHIIQAKNFKYDYKRELSYASENYHHEYTAAVYMENLKTPAAVNVRYQIDASNMQVIFNGSENFEFNLKDSTYELDLSPNVKSFINRTPLYNSIFTIKNASLVFLSLA